MANSEPNDYAATSEVRFAVVLYGGVSLAIYMNGIVQELLQLVRATAPSPADDGTLWWTDDLTGAGPVYRKLGRLLDRGVVGSGDGPVLTRFVVDIITGTSAGGINGVFLAKALAMDRDLSKLSELWVNEGDIDKLLNDEHAADDVRPLTPQRPPLSLLSGPRMLYLLLKALDGVSRAKPRADVADPAQSPYASQIDLWITATDLQGRPVSVATYNPERLGDIREADHRTTFHFRYDATGALLDADDSSPTKPLNTLAATYDPMLAFAARCTSSFPAAFQAVQLADLADVITGVSAISAAADGQQAGPAWATPASGLEAFFADYGGTDAAALHSFADGGYLNNQPVDLVMQTLPKRRADLPVARRVLLVDPDPGGGPQRTSRAVNPDNPPPPEVELTGDRIDLVGTLMKVVSLPRVQTIGGDVEKILALREPCRVRAEVYKALDDDLAATTGAGPTSGSSAPVNAAYDALRRAITARELGEAVARIGFPDRGYPAGSQHHAMATRLVSAWRVLTEQEATAAKQPETFLDSLDLGFELRRINFLQGRIGSDMKATASGNAFRTQRDMRRDLDKAYVEVATRARVLRYRDPKPSAVVTAVRTALGVIETDVDFSGSPQEIDGALTRRLQPGQPLRVAVGALMAAFSDGLELDASRRQSRAAVASDTRLAALWDRFEVYDEAMLPLRDLLPGENDDIEVLRVSPRDTWRLVDDSKQGPKLAGTQVHHFGGFFSPEWRRNDILWGRLDAAERLISALWPASGDSGDTGDAATQQRRQSDVDRDALIGEAHAAIIADVLRDRDYRALLGRLVAGGLAADPPSPIPAAEVQTVLTAIRENYRPPPPPTAQTNVIMAARAARVADSVGRGLPVPPGPLRQARVWMGRGVQAGAGVVELALANRTRSIIGRHILDIAAIAAVLMIVLGGLFGGAGVTSFGWIVLLTTIGVRLVVALLASWLAYGRWKLGVLIAAIVVVGLVVYGLLSWSGWPRAVAMLGIGLVVGLVLASVPALVHRRAAAKANQSKANQSKAGLPVAAIALAVVVLLAIAGAAAGHGHNQLGDRVCRMDDSWYRTVATRVAVVSCPPEIAAG